MAIPLTVAIVLLGMLVVVLAVVVLRQSRQMSVMTRHYEQRTDKMIAYYDQRAERLAVDAARSSEYLVESVKQMLASQPDIADRTTRAISEALSQVAKSVTDGMRAVYAPMQASMDAAGQGEAGDVITPWYGGEDGGADYTDPTDFMQGVTADGDDYSGPVIADDDSSPFGIEGLGIDPAIPPGQSQWPHVQPARLPPLPADLGDR